MKIKRLKKYILVIFSIIFFNFFNTVQSKELDEFYKKIDLFGEVLETVRDEYVDGIDQSEVMDSAINGMLQSLDPYSSYMSPETTSGCNALKFYCSVRLDVRRIASLKTSESVIGNRVRVKVVKNKVAPPFREAEMDIIFGRGISKFGELIDLGVEFGLVEKAGAWFSYSGERIGQGKDNAQKFLQANSDLGLKLEKEVREKISSK